MANFINFSVVAGFFIGLITGLIKYNDPERVLFMILVVTVSMYLIALGMATFYVYMVKSSNSMLTNKHPIEKQLEYFDSEFDQIERQARNIRNFIKSLDLNDQEENKAHENES